MVWGQVVLQLCSRGESRSPAQLYSSSSGLSASRAAKSRKLPTNNVRAIEQRSDRMFLKSLLLLSTDEIFQPNHSAFAFARELDLFHFALAQRLDPMFQAAHDKLISTPLVRNSSPMVWW
jgi:hypothetical protein